MTPGEYDVDSDEPSAEEIAQMRSATPVEAAWVDAIILRECSPDWSKVALVVGRLLDEFETALPHLPFAYMQARMQELEDAGAVEIAGDVWAMRYSEVRLVVRRNEV